MDSKQHSLRYWIVNCLGCRNPSLSLLKPSPIQILRRRRSLFRVSTSVLGAMNAGASTLFV